MKGNKNSTQNSRSISNNEITSSMSESNDSASNQISINDNTINFETYRKEIEIAEKRFNEIIFSQAKHEVYQGSVIIDGALENLSDSLGIVEKEKKDKKDIHFLKSNLMKIKKDQEVSFNVLNDYEKIISDKNGCCDDIIFEEKCVNLLKKKYHLKEYDEFPIFNKIKSSKRGTKITQVNYVEITLNILNIPVKKYFFLKDNDDYIPLNYDDANNDFHIYVLIEKEIIDNHINYLANFYLFENDSLIEKKLNKNDKNGLKYCVSLSKYEVNDAYLKLAKNLYNISCDISNSKQNEEIRKKLINSKEEIIQNMKMISSQNSGNFLTLKLEFKTQELDGFFRATEDISFSYKHFSMKIPKDAFIIIECKNNSKVESIIKNIKAKKYKLKYLGINIDNLFFLGVLYDLNKKNEKILDMKQADILKEKMFIITSNHLLDEGQKFHETETIPDTNIIMNNMNKSFQDMEKRIMDNINKITKDFEIRIMENMKKL